MTLPEFRRALTALGSMTPDDAELLDLFITSIDSWLLDATTPDRLVDHLNRLLGNVWFSSRHLHQQVFDALDAFAATVGELDGMTMNERLFTFGLFDRWDASTEDVRMSIRLKLRAS
jgi:hypothetical protein